MGRWEPAAQSRLRQAAMELFLERGYEQTTVAEIAERAGLTARTFFRYFSDKREVLFAQSTQLQDVLVDALLAAPAKAGPVKATGAALDAAAQLLGGRPEHSRQRQSVIAANRELQERELSKMANLATALADGLRLRGVAALDADLAAEAAMSVFRVAWEHWVTTPGLDLQVVMRESLQRLRLLHR